MRETIEKIIKALVSEPEAVSVQEAERDRSLILEVHVAPGDMGKVIGRGGRTIKALRSLLHAAGQKQRKRYVLDVAE